MTYRSQSRGFMYTAPPGPDDENRQTPTENAETEPSAEELAVAADAKSASDEAATEGRATELDSATGASDANWTGTVPADD